MKSGQINMTGRNGSTLRIIGAAFCIIVIIYLIYTNHTIQYKFQQSEATSERYRIAQSALSGQLKDVMASKSDLEKKFHNDKESIIGKYNALIRDHKLLMSAKADLTAQFNTMSEDCSKNEELARRLGDKSTRLQETVALQRRNLDDLEQEKEEAIRKFETCKSTNENLQVEKFRLEGDVKKLRTELDGIGLKKDGQPTLAGAKPAADRRPAVDHQKAQPVVDHLKQEPVVDHQKQQPAGAHQKPMVAEGHQIGLHVKRDMELLNKTIDRTTQIPDQHFNPHIDSKLKLDPVIKSGFGKDLHQIQNIEKPPQVKAMDNNLAQIRSPVKNEGYQDQKKDEKHDIPDDVKEKFVREQQEKAQMPVPKIMEKSLDNKVHRQPLQPPDEMKAAGDFVKEGGMEVGQIHAPGHFAGEDRNPDEAMNSDEEIGHRMPGVPDDRDGDGDVDEDGDDPDDVRET